MQAPLPDAPPPAYNAQSAASNDNRAHYTANAPGVTSPNVTVVVQPQTPQIVVANHGVSDVFI